jgi:hypothetical protein
MTFYDIGITKGFLLRSDVISVAKASGKFKTKSGWKYSGWSKKNQVFADIVIVLLMKNLSLLLVWASTRSSQDEMGMPL